MPLAQLSTSCQSLCLLPTSKLGPSGAYSRVNSPVRLGVSPAAIPPHKFFQSQVLRLYFPALEPWVAQSISLPSCSSQFICTQMWDCPVLQLPPCRESSLPGCQSPSLLPIWMNVSSLTPLLSDFHTVQFSISFGCFLFLNLLLSFFWLCKEAQCVYLRLHLGWKFLFLLLDHSLKACLVPVLYHQDLFKD